MFNETLITVEECTKLTDNSGWVLLAIIMGIALTIFLIVAVFHIISLYEGGVKRP